MIDYPKIYAFCEVASCLSFTEAADRLYTTQSSLSKTIATLERLLGCKLFFRNNRSVKLTPAGEHLYKFYSGHLSEMQRAINHAREIQEGRRGFFVIGYLGINAVSKKVSDIFADFSREFPLFCFEFMPMTIKESRELLISGKVDAVITKLPDVLPEHEFRVLSESRLVAIARHAHPIFDVHESPKLADASDYGLAVIAPHVSPLINGLIMDTCARSGYVPKTVFYESTILSMMMHVATSDFIGLTAEDDCMNSDALRRIPIDGAPVVKTVLAWRSGSANDSIRKFVEYLDRKPV